MADNKNKIVSNITAELDKLENKKFTLYFYVFDSEGNPNASLSYIYDTAWSLKELGYDVVMLYATEKGKDFIGVADWLGEEYASIKHVNVKSNPKVAPSDFLFMPEIYPSVMYDTKSLPCKRVAIIQNFGYMMDMLQPGATLSQYNIHDCVTTSEYMKKRILSVFPYMNVIVVPPCVNKVFTKSEKPQKLIVNIVSKYKRNTNEIVKSFFLKYPMFKWVCFRELYNLSKSDFAELLQEGAFTLWLDTEASFGHSALEAMACGNRVLAKLPENELPWISEGDRLSSNCVWFNTNIECVDVLGSEIYNYLNCVVDESSVNSVRETLSDYTPEKFNESVRKAYIDYMVNERVAQFKEALSVAVSKDNSLDD